MGPLRPTLVIVLCLLLLPGTYPALAQPTGPACNAPATPPPIDNRDGYLVLFEEAPIHAMELSSDGSELWVANIPDARVTVFDILASGNLSPQTEVAVGLGPVTVRQRPATAGPREIWVVCQSSNSVFVIDEARKVVLDTIRTPFEPSDLQFSADGGTAFVSLSASNQVARIDAASRALLSPTIETDSMMPPTSATASRVHVEEPRSLLLEGQDLFALSFKSGNGTLTDRFNLDGNGEVDIFNMWSIPNLPLFFAPPDRDVLRLDVSNPANQGDAVLWRMGTMNFDLERGSNGALYVSSVDLLNDLRLGKFDYQANGFSVHQVAYATPAGGNLPQAQTNFIDLNVDFDPVLDSPADPYRCAAPNEMAFSANGSRLYVACYETRNTVVIDPATDTVIADLRAAPGSPTGFGPRGVTLNEPAGKAYVFNRADNTVQAFDIPVLTGTRNLPAQTISAGFDITRPQVLAGRRHFINAANSATGIESCNTCHMDGSADGLAWDLGDFTGDLPAAIEARDDNRIKVTMDLRGIEETPPYHWQGNRDDLIDFNAAFSGLLGGSELTTAEFEEFQAFVFALSYPPNYKQDENRVYSSDAVAGFGCFTTVPSADYAIDTTGFPGPNMNPAGRASLTCEDCHGMSGGSGTNNQVNNDTGGLTPGDGMQLRGAFDKENDLINYGVPTPTDLVPATGFGFANAGGVNSLASFVELFDNFETVPPGGISTQETQLTALLTEFDSGMAPSTAFAWTLNAANAGTAPSVPMNPVLPYLIPQATAGHTDLVVRGWFPTLVGGTLNVGFLFNPATGLFDFDTSGFGSFTFFQLLQGVQAVGGALTFMGTPVGSGYRLGLDRDLDQARDGDEPGLGTSTTNPDSDGDGFPDGYEARLGSNPSPVPNALPNLPPGEAVAPVVSGESIWINSKVAKVRWTTDEEATSRVRVVPSAGGPPVFVGQDSQLKTQHSLVARNLQPGQTYDIFIESDDPAATPNMGTSSLFAGAGQVSTQPHLFASAHVVNTDLTQQLVLPITMQYLMRAQFTVVDENNMPLQGVMVNSKLVEWIPGSGTNAVQTTLSFPSDPAGVATVYFVSNLTMGSGGTSEVMVDLSNEATSLLDPGNRLFFHPLDGEFNYWDVDVGL